MKGRGNLLGFFIGAAAGSLQFYLLSKFVKAVISGNLRVSDTLIGLLQFFIPFFTLLITAFIDSGSILPVGIGIAAALLVWAIAKFITIMSKKKKVPGGEK